MHKRPIPEPLIQESVSRVMSLRDGTAKMSKSDESNYSRIDLKDSSDEIIKIMGHHSKEIEKLLGYITKSEVVHKDDMVEI